MRLIENVIDKIAKEVAERVAKEVIDHLPDIALAVAEAVIPHLPALPDLDRLSGVVVKRITDELSSRVPFFRGG